ncbi:PREDICTED: uncharacterized protein LOC106101931 isoform X2 [Papilio polytes]|uniref:uncharacterized protein LOC106101931 isoform X2 n=1 Tax=Papilio polytes TaxID=76194 RepID=UPI000676AA39|nr:PREDICTED: uncharacterized protein LOC106101931 isoform X2 [Papilio polytes]
MLDSTKPEVNKIKHIEYLCSDLGLRSPPTVRSSSSNLKVDQVIIERYTEFIQSKSTLLTNVTNEPTERSFDYFDEEFAFGINLLNNNVSCVGNNMTKLIQMAQEPWPDNVKLFQPYEVEQILLPDNASCLAVQAFLKMCNLPFEVEMRWNAEFMSPSGRVPFIKCGAFVVSELEPIVQFAANKGVTLCGRLSTEEKAEMRAYMSLITNVLVNAELYISWVDNDTFNAVTRVRNASVYPWPLGWLQTRSKRNTIIKRLKALHWYDKTLDQVLADVEQCCNSLSQRLGERDYFFGTPTPLDALAYGHIRALLSAIGPKAIHMFKPITSCLLKHLMRMTNLTQLPLTPQEEYLLKQASRISFRRSLSPEPNIVRNNIKRSKLCIKKSNRDITANSRDVFGFKPFASKQIIIMTSKEGRVTCKYDEPCNYPNYDHYEFLYELVDDIVNKAGKIIAEKEIILMEKNDFEIISDLTEECNYLAMDNINNYLETIEENNMTNKTYSIDNGEDLIQGINEEDVIDGLVADNRLTKVVSNEGDLTQYNVFTKSDYSQNKVYEYLDTIRCERKSSDTSINTQICHLQLAIPGSRRTSINSPLNEEMTLDNFMDCLSKKNVIVSGGVHVAEVD